MAVREIYKDSDGTRLPSVTTILSRFKESGGLLYWANQAGLDGKTLDEARMPAATAGTMAHDLVEAHIHGKEPPELHGDADTISKAQAAFNMYLKWVENTKIKFRHTEVSLVSDEYKFGGRLDAIGVVGNELVLCDWKTGGVYGDHLFQLAAYKLLWEINYPNQPITGGAHLCSFSRETGDFSHRYFGSLDDEAQTFLLMRELYDRVKLTEKRVK
jgi:hypothetical protein